ncbi:Exosomal 3'-5' exoribonuclease complex, subunit Rrp44/Dis3 [Ceraceosorus bombacis]|uniref:Exosomal 3'-5' exoribonuclease complex, subunit Rrp44/Dis3 n=1 Tax=Ceraceosorus bombacis TaxID=401625 RepID=A0A0P1BLN6_9BASI|nr:Exosomal 3'-5' exoribonuclease complex, subunit Rrp44/Dis3 [Ceraceosorus bombacis]
MSAKESGYIKKTQARNKFQDLVPPRPAVSEKAMMYRERSRQKNATILEEKARWTEIDRAREARLARKRSETEQAERNKDALFYGVARLADKRMAPPDGDNAGHTSPADDAEDATSIEGSSKATHDLFGNDGRSNSDSKAPGTLVGRPQPRFQFGVRSAGKTPLPEESKAEVHAKSLRDSEAKSSIERLKKRIRAMLFETPSVGAASVDARPGDVVEWRKGESGSPELCAILPMPEATGDEDYRSTGERSRGDTLIARNNKALLTSKGSVYLASSSELMFRIPDFFNRDLAARATPTEAKYFTNDSVDAPAAQTFDDHLRILKEQGNAVSFETDLQGSEAAATSTTDRAKHPINPFEEPFDEDRFSARNRITRDLRVFAHILEEEKKRLAPVVARRCLSDPDALREEGGTFSAEEVASDIDEALYAIASSNAPKINRVITKPLSRVRMRRALQAQAEAGKNPYVLEKKQELEVEDPGLRAITVLAVHQLLFQHTHAFLPDTFAYLQTLLYAGRLPEERTSMELVKSWVRSPPGSAGRSIIETFCSKAKKVLDWRSKRNVSFEEGAPRAVTLQNRDGPGVEWNKDDATIITFLKTMLGTRRTSALQGNDYAALASQIVKGCGLDFAVRPTLQGEPSEVPPFLEGRGSDVIDSSTDLQHAVTHHLLIRLGALAPWQTTLDLDPYYKTLFAADKSTAASTKVRLTAAEAETQRHDFGQLEVFVIDDAMAFELDDGVSIEKVPESPGTHWMHVHVADPTALLDSSDPVALEAKRRHESTYLSGQQISMLPHSFTIASHLGSAGLEETEAKRRQDEGLRVLSYSAKVDERGRVHDYKVRPSLIKNVKVTTYEEIGRILGGREGASSPSLAGHAETVRQLHKVTQSLMLRRVEDGAFFASRTNVEVKVEPMPLPLHSSTDAASTLNVYEGFPSIDLKMHSAASRESNHFTGIAQEMVAEAMILAGRVAGTVASDLNVPVIYRGQSSPSAADVSRILRRRDEMGRINQVDFLTSDIRVSTGYASTIPVPHFALGITADGTKGVRDALTKGGYSRGTSPLRRYVDLITHWQIKSALRGAKPRWNVEELQGELPRFKFMEQRMSANERSINQFWACMKLHRILQKRRRGAELSEVEAALLKPQPAVVSLADLRFSRVRHDARIRVQLTDLGLPAEMLWDRTTPPLPIGTVLDVQVHEIFYTGAIITLIVKPAQV